jgi:hypothetical protein
MNEQEMNESMQKYLSMHEETLRGALQLFNMVADRYQTPENNLEIFVKCVKVIKAEFNIDDVFKPLTNFINELKKLAES